MAPTATSAATATPAATEIPVAAVNRVLMTGAQLATVGVTNDQLNNFQIAFTLQPEAKKLFGDYTSTHLKQYLCIVLDDKVISCPQIDGAITEGQGVINGSFTNASANALAIQLRYGSLPVPFKVVQSQAVNATLGEDSIRKSIIAGAIGLAMVAILMIYFYRLPGFLATLALGLYAATTFALFRLIPVTLTLSGIAGFVLSVGVAVDANILIFERLKEELRAGHPLHTAIDLGWRRAWLSIRDSNISTLITCVILFWYGSANGASIVTGFAVTLFLGIVVSLFTAIVVTRTLLHLVLDNVKLVEHPRWFGV